MITYELSCYTTIPNSAPNTLHRHRIPLPCVSLSAAIAFATATLPHIKESHFDVSLWVFHNVKHTVSEIRLRNAQSTMPLRVHYPDVRQNLSSMIRNVYGDRPANEVVQQFMEIYAALLGYAFDSGAPRLGENLLELNANYEAVLDAMRKHCPIKGTLDLVPNAYPIHTPHDYPVWTQPMQRLENTFSAVFS